MIDTENIHVVHDVTELKNNDIKPMTSEDIAIATTSEFGLELIDPDLYKLINDEQIRQVNSIELIASENFTSTAVRECLASCTTNKYSEGRPGRRYYGGNQIIDKIETLCQDRALELFNLKKEEWDVNVQALSGSPANLGVFIGLLNTGDKVMGLALADGGHLSHGFSTPKEPKFTAGAAFYNCSSYNVNKDTGIIDEEELIAKVEFVKPNLLICGGSAYSRIWDWALFRRAADKVNAFLLADISHISGLVATGLHPSPFEYADVVTTTTHKTLRGPRSALVFINRKRLGDELTEAVHKGIFPGVQGGPHNHQIAGVACQLKEASTKIFKEYQQKVLNNSKKLAQLFLDNGYTLVSGGTDNHLIVIDTKKSRGVTGSKVEHVCELVDISLNKNTVPGDSSPLSPSGIRIGTPAMTSRGCEVQHMEFIYECLNDAIRFCVVVQESLHPDKTLKSFKMKIDESAELNEILSALKTRVTLFASSLAMPGHQVSIKGYDNI